MKNKGHVIPPKKPKTLRGWDVFISCPAISHALRINVRATSREDAIKQATETWKKKYTPFVESAETE